MKQGMGLLCSTVRLILLGVDSSFRVFRIDFGDSLDSSSSRPFEDASFFTMDFVSLDDDDV